MSTPSGNSAGQPAPGQAPTPGQAPPMRIRRHRPTDPLVRPKKKPPSRPAGAPPANGAAPTSAPISAPTSAPAPAAQVPPPRPVPTRPQQPPSQDDVTVNGFSGPLLSETYQDFPLVITKRSLREGLKHHVAKIMSKKIIDPRDESQFTRPVRLQRRDPRAKPQQDGVKSEDSKDSGLDDPEREELEARKAARQKQREENLAQIAPSAATNQKRQNVIKQKTQSVPKADMTPEEIAKARIRYEEALPWHLEDFDNKNVWIGNYEAALSDTYAMFVLEPTGKMRMVPIDKWYRFNQKNPFKTLSIEEAEKLMSKKVKDPRWFMEKQQELAQQKELESYAQQRKVYRGKADAGTEGLEADEMDYEEDRFADDEEVDPSLFEDDEETKAAQKRIKQDQLKANVFGLKDEKDYDEEEERERREREARRILGKKVRKALQRREKNYDYSSGSDYNPYTDDSSDDSEFEQSREEEEKQKDKGKESGASTKGSSTPSGRPKHTDALKKATNAATRKRLGSPNLSDASGTDTSRKKPKHGPAVAGLKKRHRLEGSGSDIEGGAASGGDMSDSGRPKKVKVNTSVAPSHGGTPHGSRPGSPSPTDNLKGQQRTSTPRPQQQSSSSSPPPSNFPTPAEIHAAIPPQGILSRDLLKIFSSRIGDSKENHRRFIAIVKDVGIYGKEDRLLRPGVLKEHHQQASQQQASQQASQ